MPERISSTPTWRKFGAWTLANAAGLALATGQASKFSRGPAGPARAYLKGPQGELRAWRIEVILTADAGKADRMEAYDDVTIQVEMKRGRSDRLTYYAEDERYVMTGSAIAPACAVDPNRASTGRTLVFYRSADKVLVDGNEETRTQTKSGGACAVSPSR